MARTDDRGRKPTTTYRSAYRKPPSTAGAGKYRRGDQPSWSAAAARFDRLLADRNVVENTVPPELAIPLRVDVVMSTYRRDYLLPSRVAVAKWCSVMRESGDSAGPANRTTACERPAAAQLTNVTYSGPAPPEPYVAPRPEYWWSHGQLAGRILAEQLPKRTKRCQRINPTRFF